LTAVPHSLQEFCLSETCILTSKSSWSSLDISRTRKKAKADL